MRQNRSRSLACKQGRINNSGAPYQRKAGTLFSYAKPGFLICGGALFFPKKLTTLTYTLNVQTSKQRAKNLPADRRGPLAAGAPSHGIIGTMDNPAMPDESDGKYVKIMYRTSSP